MAANFDNQEQDSQSFRARLRREKIAARQALPAPQREAAEARVIGYLADHLTTLPPHRLAFCMPVRGEVDCRPLAVRLLAAGWSACQPVVVDADQAMEFRAWTPQSPMTIDRHGLPIPAQGEVVAPDVILLPLVAFDDAGFRLGYGGGYFDRTLAALPGPVLAIGVGYELCRVGSIGPEPHDRRLDAIVTEGGLRAIERT